MSAYIYRHVDELAERAFELESLQGSIPAQDLRVIRAHPCKRCKQGRRTRIVVDRKQVMQHGVEVEDIDERDVCDRCWDDLVRLRGEKGAKDAVHLALWVEDPSGERDVVRGQVDVYPRRGAAEIPLADFTDEWRILRPIVFHRPPTWAKDRWEFGLAAYRLRLHAKIGSYGSIAYYGAQHDTQFAGWWTERRVELWVPRVRKKIEDRALDRRRRGLTLHRRIAHDS